MKPAIVYLGVLAGGGAAGAVGMGAYNALVVGVPAEEVVASAEATAEEHEPETPDATESGSGPEADGAAGVVTTPEVATTTTDGGGASVASAESGVAEATETSPSRMAIPDADSLAQVTLKFQRLANIFAAMQPEDAAAVLEQLDDAQLEGILLAMQGRNAAPILSEMEPVRAAALSRRVLEGGP